VPVSQLTAKGVDAENVSSEVRHISVGVTGLYLTKLCWWAGTLLSPGSGGVQQLLHLTGTAALQSSCLHAASALPARPLSLVCTEISFSLI